MARSSQIAIKNPIPMYYGTSQFAPYYFFKIVMGRVFGVRDAGAIGGAVIEVEITGEPATRLLTQYGIESRYIRANYMTIEDAIVYTDQRIRAIPMNERVTLRKLIKLIGGNITTLLPLVGALEAKNVFVPNNNDIQHVVALYCSYFFPSVAEDMPSYLTFGFDDSHTSFVEKTEAMGGGGFGAMAAGILDSLGALIQSAVNTANQMEIQQWLTWYKNQVIGVDGRDIKAEYDRRGPAAALVWMRRLKATSWADIDKYINNQMVNVWRVDIPEYRQALDMWKEMESGLMIEAGEIPGPMPPAGDGSSNVDNDNDPNANEDSKMGMFKWVAIGIGILLLVKFIK